MLEIPGGDIRGITLDREVLRLGRPSLLPGHPLDPGVESLHQDQAAGGRCGGGEQGRVIAAAANPAHRAGREAAQAIGLQPLGVEIGARHLSVLSQDGEQHREPIPELGRRGHCP